MRLFKSAVLRKDLSVSELKPQWGAVFQSAIFICSSFLVIVNAFTATAPDVRESHLLATRWSSGLKGKSQIESSPRAARSHSLSDRDRSERVEKQVFRLELLRQIKAIDHMKCFPKVLCGLSVDSDKSFGINKSNFVRSYLELMRNIKRPVMPVLGGGFADDRLRPQEEVEKELIWPFSPHNPDRKYHSSFERISSAAMSASVELADSPEYLSRGLGLDSRNMDGSMSMEKIDRMGVVADSIESKEEEKLPTATTSTINRMENSKIPGEKKNKKNSNKSLTAKITSYFTSWLPELPTFTWGKNERSSETGTENEKWTGRNMNEDLTPSPELLSNLEDIVDYLMTAPVPLRKGKENSQDERKGRANDDNGAAAAGSASRDDFNDGHGDHDTDIYHTAVNIGKRLKDPKQCDYIYNGCPLEYDRILDMISSLKTEIQPLEDTTEIVSQELGLEFNVPIYSTTTTTTTTTKKPQRKKPRPSTKIMHVLPNGEKVEINFRLGGSEDSEESSSSAQREYSNKKENLEDEISSERNKNSDEVMVVDLGQRTSLTSTEEVISSEKKTLLSRKGSPVDAAVIKNKLSTSTKKKFGFHPPKKTSGSEIKNEDIQEMSDESYVHEQAMHHEGQQNLKQKQTLKLSGLTLTTNNNDDQPLEISPSYVIIKHQPLSVHTTSVLSPDNLPQSQQHSGLRPHEKLQTFQLIQNGQQIDADQITDQLKNYIRQSGGIIPKLSLHSSGLITTDTADSIPITQTSYGSYSLDQQNLHAPNTNPYASFKFEPTALAGALNKLASSTQATTQQQQQPLSIAHLPYAAYYSLYNNGPEMVGSVPGRLDSLIKPKTTTTTTSTTSTTTSTTTEKIILPGMQETVMLDTDEITDDTMKKLESDNSVPGWISKISEQTSAESRESESEEDDEQTILENLNKTLMNEDNKSSKIKYKNPEKKKTRVKANSSRVRTSMNRERNKDKRRKGSSSSSYTSGSEEVSAERVVIKHAGPYSSPTVYKSPLKGPGPHGGAYPYLPRPGMPPSVFPGMPFWRMK